uniref:Uncharacterized protein n=1 Tax=Oryza brachyantha TaxID=4533 RepID=J3MS40_ORYBR
MNRRVIPSSKIQANESHSINRKKPTQLGVDDDAVNCGGGFGGHQAQIQRSKGWPGRVPAENTVEESHEVTAQRRFLTSWTSRAGANGDLGPRVWGLEIGGDLAWIWDFMHRFGAQELVWRELDERFGKEIEGGA